MALDRAKLAPVAVLVSAAVVAQLERPGIDQLQEPICRALTEREFGFTFVLIGLGRIDVFEPDLQPAVVDRVAIDDALGLVASAAQRELASSGDREPTRCRENVETQPLLHKDRSHDTDEHHQTDRRDTESSVSRWSTGGRKSASPVVEPKPGRRPVERHPCHCHCSAAALRQRAQQWQTEG